MLSSAGLETTSPTTRPAVVALTGSDGVSDDVDDDAGDADVGHPRDALLPKHTTASGWYY